MTISKWMTAGTILKMMAMQNPGKIGAADKVRKMTFQERNDRSCGFLGTVHSGELPNSFAKRQIGIAPGGAGSGLSGRAFWVVDQLDSLLGMLLFVAPVWQPSLALLAVIIAIMLVAHPVIAWIMVLFGLKDRVG